MMERAGIPLQAPQFCGSRRHWSLWDMLEFWPSNFIQLAKEVGRLGEVFARQSEKKRSNDTNEQDLKVFSQLAPRFENLGLRMCAAQNNRIIKALKDNMDDNKQFSVLMNELYTRLVDECVISHFMSFSEDEWVFISPPGFAFGEAVQNGLPGIIEDIYEASSCLGFHRPTAAVFHLMRIMEAGVQRFGSKLGVELTEEKVWQTILDNINTEIKKLGKSNNAKIYASINAHLYNVKLAWRNETMHPKATYTDDEARAIFTCVRNFMQSLVEIL